MCSLCGYSRLRSLKVSDKEIIGVMEFMISWVSTRISFCHASISVFSNAEWIFFKVMMLRSLPLMVISVDETASSRPGVWLFRRTI